MELFVNCMTCLGFTVFGMFVGLVTNVIFEDVKYYLKEKREDEKEVI